METDNCDCYIERTRGWLSYFIELSEAGYGVADATWMADLAFCFTPPRGSLSEQITREAS